MNQIRRMTMKGEVLPVALTGLLAPVTALADAADGNYYGHHAMMGWGGGWLFGPLMLLLFFGLLVAAVVVTARLLGIEGWRPAHHSHDRALTILRERFARGELSQQEFEAAKKTLE